MALERASGPGQRLQTTSCILSFLVKPRFDVHGPNGRTKIDEGPHKIRNQTTLCFLECLIGSGPPKDYEQLP